MQRQGLLVMIQCAQEVAAIVINHSDVTQRVGHANRLRRDFLTHRERLEIHPECPGQVTRRLRNGGHECHITRVPGRARCPLGVNTLGPPCVLDREIDLTIRQQCPGDR